MKTPEDEAFEDIERRQGGFQAKRQMVADKLQEPDWKTMPKKDAPLVQWAKEQTALQPTQEPMAWQWLGSAHFRKKLPKNADITAWNPLYTSPPRREWVGLTNDERKALERFTETCDDGEGYDVTKHMMQRLAQIGVVHHTSGGVYSTTEFGRWVIDAAPPQRERVVFPTMLRKMWSGGEVQAWLDENVNKEQNNG